MFIIPDHDETAHPNQQSVWFATDLECLIRAIQGVASVRSGCTVDPQSPLGLGVTVAAGTVVINGAAVTVAGGSLTIDTADADPRIDLVTAKSTGAFALTKGVPAIVGSMTGPKPSDIPTDEVLLALILVLGGATKIAASEIVDKRVIVLDGLSSDALKGTIGAPSNANRFVTAADPRLWNARRPRLHAQEHEAGGGDALDLTGLHGRVGDPQAPGGHHETHQAGGPEAITLDDVAAPDDNTDLNVTTSRHGLMPKGSTIDDVYRGNATLGPATTVRADQSASGRVVSPVGPDKWA